jgi:hypothetical protein
VTIPPAANDAAPELECVVYVSTASGILGAADLEGLLTSAWRRNAEHRVTGALLFDDGTFLQYFEGPPAGVAEVYRHIQRSPMHRGIVELHRARVPKRQFPQWLMGFSRAPGSAILRLSNATWQATLRGRPDAAPSTEGLELLLDFWRSSKAAVLDAGA